MPKMVGLVHAQLIKIVQLHNIERIEVHHNNIWTLHAWMSHMSPLRYATNLTYTHTHTHTCVSRYSDILHDMTQSVNLLIKL